MDKVLGLEGAQILYDDNRKRVEDVRKDLQNIDNLKVDGARVSEDGKYLYLTSHDEDVAGPYGPFSGGGGGGGGSDNEAKLTVINQSGDMPTAVPTGGKYVIKLYWTSIEQDMPTGSGTIEIKVNKETKVSGNIPQGEYQIDLMQYLIVGDNSIKITISDIYENARTVAFSIRVVSYSLVGSDSFDPSQAYNGTIPFSFTARGEGTKTMHFLIDDKEVLTKNITSANREDTVELPKQSHGAHRLVAYFTTMLSGETITSNSLSYDLICYEEDNPTTIIASSLTDIEVDQYSTISIPYYVFNALHSTVDAEYLINGEVVSTLTNVSRSLQTWVRRAEDAGAYTYTIRSGSASKDFKVSITKLNVDISAETSGLSLHLSSEGRSNNEEPTKRSTWEYEGIKAQFRGFNWNSDGWVLDNEGHTVLRAKDDARVVIPYHPFGTSSGDIKSTGKTLEFEFATSSVFDYDTPIISCLSGGKGFQITAQQALFASNVSSLKTQYKENEHVRISFVINNISNNRLIYCYINGIISGLITYPVTDIFYQNPEVDITIGSADAVVDVYRIRIYDRALSRFQVVNNWIADMQDGAKLLEEYRRNTIYDDNDNLSLDLIKTHLPTLPYIVVYTGEVTDKKGNLVGHLPTYKGEKLLVSGYYVDPVNPQNSFSWKNGEIDVQGTSSQAYPIKNFKLKIKRADTYEDETTRKPTDCSGFIMTQLSEEEGKEHTEKKYPLRGYDENGKALSIKENTFVFKADYASSEGCNNVELVRFYNDVCTQYVYPTPPQQKDKKIRQGIDGFPMVWFEVKGGEVKFIGKYNFNNHKGTEDTYGLSYGGETFEETAESDYYRSIVGAPDESWEVTDNNNLITLWRRVAGDATKTTITDSAGRPTTYDVYISGDNFELVKTRSLEAIYLGSSSSIDKNEYPKYTTWATEWQKTYTDLNSWITGYALTSIYDAGEGLDDETKAQRDLIILTMKKDIRDLFSLTEVSSPISPEEDMLGEWGKGEAVAHAFEVRFPGEWYDAHTEGQPEVVKVDRFVALQKWVVSTDPNKVTNEKLEKPVTYAGTTYDIDNEAYRLAKFKNELGLYFDIEDTLFYYIYTELFLMIDSRVKNSFPTYYSINHDVQAFEATTGEPLYEECGKKDVIEEGKSYFKYTESEDGNVTYEPFEGNIGDSAVDSDGNKLYTYMMTQAETLDKNGWPLGRWCWLPYDMDTGIGINNEGLLVFDYSLEDTEALIGDRVVKIGTPGSEDGVPVFNGASSVLWNNVRKCFPSEIADRYITLRGGAMFNYDTIEKRYEDHQYMWPAAIFNEDAYYKYILPLLTTGEDRLGMCLGSKEQQRKWWMFNRFRFLDSKYVAGDAVNSRISFRVNDLAGDKTIRITPYIDLYVKVKQGEAWESTPTKVYRNKELPVYINVPEAGDTEAYIYSADQIREIKGLNQSLHISTLDISKAVNLQHLDVSSTDSVKGNTTLAQLAVGANTLLRSIDARNCRVLGDISQKYFTTVVDLSQCEQLEEAYFNGTKLATVMLPEGGRLRTVYLPSSITTLNIENQGKIKDIQILDFDGNWDTSNIETLIIDNVNTEVQLIALDIIHTLKSGSFVKFRGFDITLDSKDKFTEFIDKLFELRGEGGTDVNVANIQGTIHLKTTEVIDYAYYKRTIDRFKDLVIDAEVAKTVQFYNYDGTVKLDTQVSTDNSAATGRVEYKGEAPTKPDTVKIHYVFDGWTLTPGGALEEDILDNITGDLIVYAHFKEIPIYYVNFYNYDGTVKYHTGYTYDVGDVEYKGDKPAYNDEKFGTVEFMGWGTVKYGSANLIYESGKIRGVDRDIEAYAIMNWPIISFEVTKNPNRLNYWPRKEENDEVLYEGDYIDLEGIEVTSVKSTPSGNQEAQLLSYDYEPKTRLTLDNHTITISTRGRIDGADTTIERTLNIGLAVSSRLMREADRSVFFLEDDWDPEGMEVEYTFDNSDTELVHIPAKTEGVCSWVPEKITEIGWKGIEVNYKGFKTMTRAFGVKNIGNLNETDWETISAVSQAGLAANWWSIGDTKTVYLKAPNEIGYKETTAWQGGLNTYRIIAFDHNMDVESPNRHTITFALATSSMDVYDYTIVDKLPDKLEGETGSRKTYAISKDEIGQYYDLYYYNNSTEFEVSKHYIGRAECLSGYNGKKIMRVELEVAHAGGMMSTPNDGSEYSGVKYSWGKGCNLREICKKYPEAMPKDMQAVLIDVVKSQRDTALEEYPWPLDAASSNRWDFSTKIRTQYDRVYIASWMELTGSGRSNLMSATPPGLTTIQGADESECCKQFEYYKNGGSTLRLKFGQLGTTVYATSYPTRSYEAFRWIPAYLSTPEYFSNYYAWVGYDGDLQNYIWSTTDATAPFVPIYTV